MKLLFYCVNTSYPMDNCLPVSATGPAKRQKAFLCKVLAYDRSRSVHSLDGAPYFLSRHADVIASFSFAWSVQTCFLQSIESKGFFWRLAGPVTWTGKAIVHWIGY